MVRWRFSIRINNRWESRRITSWEIAKSANGIANLWKEKEYWSERKKFAVSAEFADLRKRRSVWSDHHLFAAIITRRRSRSDKDKENADDGEEEQNGARPRSIKRETKSSTKPRRRAAQAAGFAYRPFISNRPVIRLAENSWRRERNRRRPPCRRLIHATRRRRATDRYTDDRTTREPWADARWLTQGGRHAVPMHVSHSSRSRRLNLTESGSESDPD